MEARTAIQHFAEGQHMLPGSIEEAEAGAEAWAAAAEAIKGTEAAREAAAAEPKPEADAAMEGRQLTEYSMLRLWATSECRERWRGALQPPPQAPPQAPPQPQAQPQSQSQSHSPPPSFATVALCAHALRAHADAFAAAASKKRPSERTSRRPARSRTPSGARPWPRKPRSAVCTCADRGKDPLVGASKGLRDAGARGAPQRRGQQRRAQAPLLQGRRRRAPEPLGQRLRLGLAPARQRVVHGPQ